MSESALDYDSIRDRLRHERVLNDEQLKYLNSKYIDIMRQLPIQCIQDDDGFISAPMTVATDSQQSVINRLKKMIRDRTDYLNSLPVIIPGHLL